MAAQNSNGISLETVLIAGAVAAGLYLAYKAIQGVSAAAAAVGHGVVAGSEAVYHGAQVITSPVSTGVANLILTFDPKGVGNVPGNVLFPDGYVAPLSSLPVATQTDAQGTYHVYVKDRGSTWELSPSDSDGDWPATYVSG